MFDIRALLIAIAASLSFGFAGGWTVHGWQMNSAQLHTVKAEAKHVVEVTQKQSQITAAVEGADAVKQQKIHATFTQLQREVPKHVTPEVDRQFPVSDRLVGVLDRALNVPAVPDGAGRADDGAPAASAVAESDLGAWATQVIEQSNSTRQQLIDLQAWVRAQTSGRIPKEVSVVDWNKMIEDGEAEMVGGRLYKGRVEVGRLVDGKFVVVEGGVEAAAAPVVQPAAVVSQDVAENPQVAEPQHTVTEGPTLTLAEVQAAEVQSLGPVEPQSHDEKPAERPAIDAAAMLGD